MHSLIAMTHWRLDILVLKTLWLMYLSLSTRGAKQNIEKGWRTLVDAIFSHWTWVDWKKNVKEKLWKNPCAMWCFSMCLIFHFWGFPHFQRHPMAESCKEAWVLRVDRCFTAQSCQWWMMMTCRSRTLGGKIRCKKTGFSPNSTNDEVPVVQNENLGTPLQRLWSIFLIGGIKWQKMAMAQKWVIFKKNAWEY